MVRAVHWRDSDSLARWTAPEVGTGELTADPGWRLDLPFDHGFDLAAGDQLTVYATFAAHDGDQYVPVGLQNR